MDHNKWTGPAPALEVRATAHRGDHAGGEGRGAAVRRAWPRVKKVWLEQYPPGVPHEIDPDAYPSLTALIDERVAQFADRPAFSSFGTRLTYRQFDELAAAFSVYLRLDLGLTKGDRLALFLPNLLQYPVAMLGALRAGLIVVNVNPQYTPRELAHQLNDADVAAIVAWADVTPTLAAAIAQTNVRHSIVTQTADLLESERTAAPVAAGLPHAVRFQDALTAGRASARSAGGGVGAVAPPTLHGRDLAFLQYTGGTTGPSKGAMLTHRNLVANVLQNYAAFSPLNQEDQDDIYITALPLYHIYALTSNCLSCINKGGLNVLITNPRDLAGFVAELTHWKFTYISGVTTLYNALLNTPGFADLDFSALRVSVAGGMALHTVTAARWQEVTACVLLEGYGLSETSPTLTVNPTNVTEHTGTVGVPIPSTEISIRDDRGHELPTGTPGEICARGPQVTTGYWRRDDATREVMTHDGFFRTGDVGVIDEKGFVKIVDRKKDMVVVSGFKVYPNEVEDVAASLEGILECACIGTPDERTGEAVTLCVVPKQDRAITPDDIRAWCKVHLAAYKVPSRVEFLKELPKSNVGKILRRKLREGV